MTINIKGSIIPDSWADSYARAGLSYCCPGELTKALDKADGQPVDFVINSPGGSVDAAREIYDAIRGYKGQKRIHVVGMAASAASVIACAGPSDISPIGMLLLHNVYSPGTAGDYHAQDQESRILQQTGRSLAAAYVDKSGMSLEAALALMDKESWLTAKEAVELGLIDEIAQPAQQPRSDKQKAKAQLELLRLKGEKKHD